MVRTKQRAKRTDLGPLYVRLANGDPDPLADLPRSFANGPLSLRVVCGRASHFDVGLRDWAFDLTEGNMRAMYEASNWGWNPSAKRRELCHEDALYLVAESAKGPCGFVHFRFDMDFGRPVLYCYEIQLESAVQRKGLGTFLMSTLEALASKFRMHRVVLTVFRSNGAALDFYVERLGYCKDKSCPPEGEADYVILSKKVPSRST